MAAGENCQAIEARVRVWRKALRRQQERRHLLLAQYAGPVDSFQASSSLGGRPARNTVCGVNSADNIYCKDSLTGRDWTRLSGGLKHISVSGGVLYGVNSKTCSDEKAVSVNVAIS